MVNIKYRIIFVSFLVLFLSPIDTFAQTGSTLNSWVPGGHTQTEGICEKVGETHLRPGSHYATEGVTRRLRERGDLITIHDPTGALVDSLGVTFADDGGGAADMAYDFNHNLLWCVKVGNGLNDNCIYGINPDTGEVEDSLCGDWIGNSARGLAYDNNTDTFYIGCLDTTTIFVIAGDGTPGTNINFSLDHIAGLAFHERSGKLAVTTTNRDSIYIIDSESGEIESMWHLPNSETGAKGCEFDMDGNLWFAGQKGNIVYQLEFYSLLGDRYINLFDISGDIQYGLNTNSISDVNLNLNEELAAVSNSNGDYEIKNIFGDQNYSLDAAKEGGANGITSFDAARIAQNAANLYEFNEYQQIAGDVTGDSTVTTLDASRVAQYAAELEQPSFCGEWTFLPEYYEYTPLQADLADQDFVGILYGDVTGNWSPPEVDPAKMADSYEVNSAAAPVQVVKTASGTTIKNPDVATTEVIAFQFIVESEKSLSATLAKSIPEDWELLINQKDEKRWYIGAYGITPLSSEKLVEINGDESLSIIWGLINEKAVKSQPIIAVPKKCALYSNYPNPFNPTTTIHYDLPAEMKVKLSIYNISGQLVKRLVADQQVAGRYSVEWNGTDENGNTLSSGAYIYRLDAGDQELIKRMTLLK